VSDRSGRADRLPPLPEPLPVAVVDNHCHLDIPGATRELAGEKMGPLTGGAGGLGGLGLPGL